MVPLLTEMSLLGSLLRRGMSSPLSSLPSLSSLIPATASLTATRTYFKNFEVTSWKGTLQSPWNSSIFSPIVQDGNNNIQPFSAYKNRSRNPTKGMPTRVYLPKMSEVGL